VSVFYASSDRDIKGAELFAVRFLMLSSAARCCVVLLLLNPCISAKEPYHWTEGKVVKLTVRPEVSSLNAGKYAELTKVFTYTIQGDDGLHVAQERAKRATATVESKVQYSLSDKYVYLKDSEGKVHKLNPSLNQAKSGRFRQPRIVTAVP